MSFILPGVLYVMWILGIFAMATRFTRFSNLPKTVILAISTIIRPSQPIHHLSSKCLQLHLTVRRYIFGSESALRGELTLKTQLS
jgi:hypothetical protein